MYTGNTETIENAYIYKTKVITKEKKIGKSNTTQQATSKRHSVYVDATSSRDIDVNTTSSRRRSPVVLNWPYSQPKSLHLDDPSNSYTLYQVSV